MKTILKISGMLCLVLLSQAFFAQERWEKITVPSSRFLRSLCFPDSLYGWVSGGMFDIAGVIRQTHNGGKTWSAMDPAQAPAL